MSANAGSRGSGGGTRTHNLRINSPPLCQLSYPGRVATDATGPTPAFPSTMRHDGSGPGSRSLGSRRDRLLLGSRSRARPPQPPSPPPGSTPSWSTSSTVTRPSQTSPDCRRPSTTLPLPFVRTAWNHPADLMRCLDLGFQAVICPMVGSSRGRVVRGSVPLPAPWGPAAGPMHGAFGRGRDHTRAAEEATLLLRDDRVGRGSREPRRDRVDARPRRPLRRAGRPQSRDGSRHVRRPDRPCAARRAGLRDRRGSRPPPRPGMHAPSPPDAAAMARRGFRLVSCAVDEDLLREAARVTLRDTRGAETRGARQAPGPGDTG